MTAPDREAERERIAGAAADWIVRHDRGLAPQEEASFREWLAAAPEHAAVFAERRRLWASFDAVAAPPATTRKNGGRRSRPWTRAVPVGLAAAIAVLAAWTPRIREAGPLGPAAPTPALAPLVPAERRFLADGSTIDLGPDAQVEIDFVAGERRVRLRRGAAHFQVARDPARPFVVVAGGVEVRAVGTIFNVRLDPAAVEVVVAEGRVKVAAPSAPGDATPILAAGQQALVPLAGPAAPAHVVTLSPAQLQIRLAWQPRLLDFTDEPLAAILAEFNRRNDVELTVADPSLAALRLSATFRSDNVEGFLRLMESEFGIATERTGARTIVLRRGR